MTNSGRLFASRTITHGSVDVLGAQRRPILGLLLAPPSAFEPFDGRLGPPQARAMTEDEVRGTFLLATNAAGTWSCRGAGGGKEERG